jgi:hypothetical protein
MANQENENLKLAFEAIRDKRKPYDTLYSYFDGNPSLKYSTQRLQRAFGNSGVYFAENWAGVIINAVLDRLVLKGFDSGNDSINNQIDELFTKMNLNLDARDIHETLQVVGEAYLIVDVVDGETEVYFNDARQCEMFYDSNRPKVKAYAAKEWIADSKTYLNLYYPDRTEKYVSDKGTTAKSFELMESIPNELGIIPVFHFRNSRRIIKGELDTSTASIIDAINKLFSDMMVMAEFYAFPVRAIITQADVGDLQSAWDRFIKLPARETEGEDTKVVELLGADLTKILTSINQLAESLAVQTRTPKHYLISLGANISGEALVVEESGLVKKVMSKQESYSPTWQEFASYLLLLNGVTVDRNELMPVWEKPESKLPLTEAQTTLTNTQAGVPLVTALRWRGADEADIQQLEEDRTEDDSRKQVNDANLVNAIRNRE